MALRIKETKTGTLLDLPVTMSESGNLYVRGLEPVSASQLYQSHLKRNNRGLAILLPLVQFRGMKPQLPATDNT